MSPLTRDELVARIRAGGWWYQRIDLGEGVFTTDGPQYHEVVWQRIAPAFPAHLEGVAALDVGCNAGYFAIEMKRPAARVGQLAIGATHLEKSGALNRDVEWVGRVIHVPLREHDFIRCSPRA